MKSIKSFGPKFCNFNKKHHWFARKNWNVGDWYEVRSYRANVERKRRAANKVIVIS